MTEHILSKGYLARIDIKYLRYQYQSVWNINEDEGRIKNLPKIIQLDSVIAISQEYLSFTPGTVVLKLIQKRISLNNRGN